MSQFYMYVHNKLQVNFKLQLNLINILQKITPVVQGSPIWHHTCQHMKTWEHMMLHHHHHLVIHWETDFQLSSIPCHPFLSHSSVGKFPVLVLKHLLPSTPTTLILHTGLPQPSHPTSHRHSSASIFRYATSLQTDYQNQLRRPRFSLLRSCCLEFTNCWHRWLLFSHNF